MAQLSARQIALAALRLWRKEKRFADSIVSELLAKAGLPPSDRAFALELFYGVLRNLTLLDFWIARDEFLRLYSGARPLTRDFEFGEFDSLPTNALTRGHCYIQDPSTLLACQVLDPKPGEKVLDACAAPGGKTGYIAQLMENLGIIVACDRDPERLETLKQNMARLGVV